MARLMGGFLMATMPLVAGAVLYEQNCASRGLCRVPIELRDPALHQVSEGDPPGHLRPLGDPAFDQTWDGEVDEFDGDIPPELFWQKYYPFKPFVMRGVAKKHPAFHKWKDDGYISKNFGQYKVKTENKNEDRLTDYCGMEKMGQRVDCPRSVLPYTESYMNISSFLSRYKNPDHDTYAISQLPTLMAKDVIVSPSWNCGRRPKAELEHKAEVQSAPWMTQLYETNLWINHNEGQNFSSSVIHYDMNHQMMCIYDGEKEWYFWDLRSEIDHIPTWSEYYSKQHQRPTGGSDDSPIDGERVDLKRYPEFAHARWTNTTIRAGDCLYTPAHIMHYVRSTSRNIAAMYMFQTGTQYAPSQCAAESAASASQTLDKFDVLWEFPGSVEGGAGWNQVKMGFPDWKRQYRAPILRMAGGTGTVRKSDFLRMVAQFDEGHMFGALERAVHAAFEAVGATGAVEAATVVSSPVFDELFRSMAVVGEFGDEREQELDTRFHKIMGKATVREEL